MFSLKLHDMIFRIWLRDGVQTSYSSILKNGTSYSKLLVFLQFISVPILTFLNIFKWTTKFCGFSKMLNLVDFYIIQGVWICSIILQDHSQGLNLVIIHICLFMMLCGIWMVWHYHHWSSRREVSSSCLDVTKHQNSCKGWSNTLSTCWFNCSFRSTTLCSQVIFAINNINKFSFP